MPYIGQAPAPKVITSSDLSADVVTEAKIADNAVENEHLNANVITGHTALGAEPADTDEFLVSDAGTLKRIDYSYIKGGGSHTLLSTTTVSSGVANVDITSNIDSTYKAYMIEIINMHPATNDTTLRMQFIQGSSVYTNNYDYVFDTYANQATSSIYNDSSGNHILMTYAQNNASDAGLSGRVFLYDPADTTFNTQCLFTFVYQVDGDNCRIADGCGRIENTIAFDGVRFFMSSGNIDSGIFKLYGIT